MIIHVAIQEAERLLEGASQQLRGAAMRAGLTAYMRTVRQASMTSGPGGVFARAEGYRIGVHKRYRVGAGQTAFLHSGAGFGNVIESGFAGHVAKGDDTITSGGNVLPGIATWIRKHNLEEAVGFSAKSKALKVRSRQGTPWVIPTHDRVQDAARDAFLDAISDAIAKEVT